MQAELEQQKALGPAIQISAHLHMPCIGLVDAVRTARIGKGLGLEVKLQRWA